ncbi:hypothetical protein Lser_V15G41448 [Lactuca serriola]
MTLTAPVPLCDCLRSIKNHAFAASKYLFVITLEDHLTPDLQANLAKMVTETFGEMLLTPKKEGLAEFLSPESLKKRFIISTKPPKEYVKAKAAKPSGNSSQKEQDSSVEKGTFVIL